MKVLKKYSVAWIITIVVILASCVFGLVFARADMLPVNADDWVYDGADVLSAETEETVRVYNAEFDEYYAYVAVATVDNLRGRNADSYAEKLYNRWELYSYDFMLLLDVGGGESYLYYGSNRSGFDYESYLDTYVNPWFYSGDYDMAVLSLMEGMEAYLSGGEVSVGNWGEDSNWYGGYSGYGGRTGYRGWGVASIVVLVIILVVVLFLILNLVERSRYNRWYGQYGGMAAPPVAFVPIFFWHRPGSMWWRRRFRGPGPGPRGPGGFGRGPRPGGGPPPGGGARPGGGPAGGARPGGGPGGSARPGSGFGGSSHPSGGFGGGGSAGGGHGSPGGFGGGGFGGGHGGGGFGGGGHGGSFGGGGHGGGGHR